MMGQPSPGTKDGFFLKAGNSLQGLSCRAIWISGFFWNPFEFRDSIGFFWNRLESRDSDGADNYVPGLAQLNPGTQMDFFEILLSPGNQAGGGVIMSQDSIVGPFESRGSLLGPIVSGTHMDILKSWYSDWQVIMSPDSVVGPIESRDSVGFFWNPVDSWDSDWRIIISQDSVTGPIESRDSDDAPIESRDPDGFFDPFEFRDSFFWNPIDTRDSYSQNCARYSTMNF